MQETIQGFIDDEIEWADYVLKCAEDWSSTYEDDPDTHEKLMRTEARLERKIRKVFRDISKDAGKYFSKSAYKEALKNTVRADVQVDVIVTDSIYDNLDDSFIRITFDTLLLATTLGAQAGETIYKIPLGIDSTDKAMMDLTTKQLANLVGRRITYKPDGTIDEITANPNAKYRISDKTREDVASSIKTSINLGENIEAATKRLANTIDSPKRAEMIARTETVNAYSAGLLEFGRQSNATGKQWQSVGATDVCASYSNLGVVEFDYIYDPVLQLKGPAAHPNCRCGLRLTHKPLPPKQ